MKEGPVVRSLAVLMSALVAMSAQAQDASTAGSEGKPAPAARSKKAKRRPATATRAQPVESGAPVPQPSALQAKPDAGVDASIPEDPPHCGMGQWIFSDEPAPVAIRFYPEGTAVALPQEAGLRQTWKTPPEVWKVGRCLDKYFIQLRSSSKKPWELKDAMLVGAEGEILRVTDVRSRLGANNKSINIVEAERTKGVTEPNYRLATLVLVGKDSRIAILQNLELP
jgi:hypothetical protein